LRCAVDEVRYHDLDCAIVTGAVLDFSPVELHAMALMGAIAYQSFNDQPAAASRPWDTRREGFIPAHGGGVLVVEPLELALKRGAKIYAEILGVEANSDGNHLPQPSEEGQARLMARLLKMTNIEPEQIDYINAHATSTPVGDASETKMLKLALGEDNARTTPVSGTKGATGHCLGAAGAIEAIFTVLAIRDGKLPPTINYEVEDPACDLDYVPNTARDAVVDTAVSNSFGFGGHNACVVFQKFAA
jgi:3-oxoacyl-(acyl-carrier-protein) synthase